MQKFLMRTVESALENIIDLGGAGTSPDDIAVSLWQDGDTASIVSAAKSCAAIEMAVLTAETLGVWPFREDRETLLKWAYTIDPVG